MNISPALPLHCLKQEESSSKLYYDSLPIIYGKTNISGKYIEEALDINYVGIDIFGSAFFMLTRMEEYIITDRDEHDRFPVESSIAYKVGFLERQ